MCLEGIVTHTHTQHTTHSHILTYFDLFLSLSLNVSAADAWVQACEDVTEHKCTATQQPADPNGSVQHSHNDCCASSVSSIHLLVCRGTGDCSGSHACV